MVEILDDQDETCKRQGVDRLPVLAAIGLALSCFTLYYEIKSLIHPGFYICGSA